MKLHNGDCLQYIKTLETNSIDAIVTDPPYGLKFMGSKRDYDVPSQAIWEECLRVLKPGGHLMAFAGTRTQHRMAVRIEDAGFDIKDMIMRCYGSGFPKSLNIGKAVDKRGGTTSDQSKEFAEYIKNRRTELNITLSKADEVICGGTTNYSWFEGRPVGQRLPRKADYLKMKELLELDDRYDSFMEETERELIATKDSLALPINDQLKGWGEKKEYNITKGISDREGRGTGLKPAVEPVTLARKPIEKGLTISENCMKWGTGGLNIDISRVGTSDNLNGGAYSGGERSDGDWKDNSGFKNDKLDEYQQPQGRFPANLIHDNSEEVRECFPESKSTQNKISDERQNEGNSMFIDGVRNPENSYTDSGNASRFFKSIIYQAKASKSERNKGCEELEEKLGRFPANLILGADENGVHEEVRECFPETKSGGTTTEGAINNWGDKRTPLNNIQASSGNASRFFKSIIYQAKSSKAERNKGCEGLETSEKFTAGNYSQSPTCKTCDLTLNGTNDHSECSGEVYYKEMESKNTKNNHPTVKPIALMEYLINMITREGQIVLDPFMGSGTTGIAAKKLGRDFVGCELDPDYFKIAECRIKSITPEKTLFT